MSELATNKTILIVEDSDDDFEFTERAFKNSNLSNPIRRCVDGQDALDYLLLKGEYNKENAVRPGLVLLDLNMPAVGGEEVLAEIKGNDELKDIPVMVLTTSSDPLDFEKYYEAGANTYIEKPVEIEKFFEAIKRLKECWLEIDVLPKS